MTISILHFIPHIPMCPHQWRSQGGARGGDRPPNRKKNHSLKKAKSVEKLGEGGVHVTSPKLKLIKYVATKENDDILEEHDL